MTTIVLDYAPRQDDQQRRVIGWLEAAVLAGAGIFLPMLCFAASFRIYPGGPEYQRGYWSDYLTLVPSVTASWPFAPLLFAATFALAVLLVAPHRAAQSWLLRWALYSGAILSVQYTLIQAIAFAAPSAPLSLGNFVMVIMSAIATLLALGGLSFVPRVPSIKLTYWLPCLVLSCFVAVVLWRITLPVVLLSAMLIAIVAPAITLAAYLRASLIVRRLMQQAPSPRGRMPLRIPLAWLATYATLWAPAFLSAVDLYNSLPKKPPDC